MNEKFLAAALVALSVPCLPVQPASAEPEPAGPRLVLIPQRSVPMFSCTVLVPAGSALETPATNGAAHYLEHLLFNGTETRTREQIYAEGDLLGAYNNASTQRERTVFQLLLPSENWKEGLALQADMLLHSLLPEEMFEKEKGIILEELAKDRTSPDYAAQRRTAEILWDDDPRALPTLGTEESIDGMDLEALRAFYRARYRPGGMTIVLMGDFGEAAARTAVRHLYGKSEPPPPLPPAPPFPSPAMRHFRAVEGLGKTRVTVMLPMPAVTSPDYAAAEILTRVLNEGERCAVSPAVENAVGPVQSCSAGLSAGEGWSLLTIGADFAPAEGTDPEGAGAAAVDAVLRHLGTLADGRSVAGDLTAAKRGALTEEISLHEKMHYYGLMRADLLGSPDPAIARHLPERIQAVGAPAVTAVLRGALRAGNALAIVLGEGLADRGEELGDDAFGVATASWPRAPEADGDEFGAPPPAVDAPESRRVVLDNGFTLIIKSTPEARTFAAHLLLRDRARGELAGGVPRGTSDVVLRMTALGTADLTEDELRGRLALNAVSLKVTDSDWIPYDDYYFSPEFAYVRVETIDSFALPALELMGDMVLRPRWTEETFAKAKAAAIARAERDQATPRSVATNLFLDRLGSDHPEEGGVLGPAEELETLTLEQARKHHATLTAPGAMALVVSSSLPAEVVEEAVRAAFGGVRETALPERAGFEPAGDPGGRQEAELGLEQSWIVLGAPLRDVAPEDEPALRVAAAVLSERLAEQLREREGLAYSIGAGLRLEGEGPYVRMAAGTRAENLDRMEAGMREVAAELAVRPPTEDEIDGARNRGEGRRRMRRLSRMGDAYAMAMAELAGRDPLALDADLPALRAVTPADVARVAERYFTFDPGVVAVAR